MVFKLVRTDVTEPCKLQLTVGKHLVGRGKFLDCEDKRVSRNHGELEVTADTVLIKALHQNPCFIIKKGSEEGDMQLLKQGDTSELYNGDRFGLLPNLYWYELIHCIDEVDNQAVQSDVATASNISEHSYGGDTEPSDNGDKSINMNDTTSDERSESPSLLQTQIVPQEYTKSSETMSSDEQKNTETPFKRSHSQEVLEDAVKKIKTEPEIKQEPEEGQPDSQRAGPSNDQGNAAKADDKGMPPSPTKPQNPPRERCIYGASCYRRNPQHKAEFSHPTDADWGAGERGECPWGAACRRRDGRHWAAHTHPPDARPPPPRPAGAPPRNDQGKKTKRPKRRDSSDEDTPTTDLIVQGKRTRKTIKRENYWSGSESENEDPFQTDESDEWQPTSDLTDSQIYTQDTQDFDV